MSQHLEFSPKPGFHSTIPVRSSSRLCWSYIPGWYFICEPANLVTKKFQFWQEGRKVEGRRFWFNLGKKERRGHAFIMCIILGVIFWGLIFEQKVPLINIGQCWTIIWQYYRGVKFCHNMAQFWTIFGIW